MIEDGLDVSTRNRHTSTIDIPQHHLGHARRTFVDGHKVGRRPPCLGSDNFLEPLAPRCKNILVQPPGLIAAFYDYIGELAAAKQPVVGQSWLTWGLSRGRGEE